MILQEQISNSSLWITIISAISAFVAIVAAIISGIKANIARKQAIYAERQAKATEEQAKSTKQQVKIVEDSIMLQKSERKRLIIEECIKYYKVHGEWQTYLDTIPDLTEEEKEVIDKAVRKRLGKD